MNELNSSERPPDWQSWGGRLLVVFLGIWIINVVWTAQTAVWFIVGSGGADDRWPWLWATAIQLLLTAVPLLPLAWKWPIRRYRAVFQSWLLACLYPLLLAPTRLLAPTQSQLLLLAQIALSLLLLAILLIIKTNRSLLTVHRLRFSSLAVGTAVFVCLPWFAWGALGSPLDTMLALLLGLLFGAVVAGINGRTWLSSLQEDSRGVGWDMLTGGWVMGTAVLSLASGLSFNGGQLPLMIVLPALGWAMMGMAWRGNGRMAGLLAGLAAAFILVFTDTDGLVLIAFDGILRWTMQAAFFSMWLALLAGIVMRLLRRRLVPAEDDGKMGYAIPVFAFLSIALALAIFLMAGQPGFHGDRLFVILKDQADVTAAAQMTNYDQRRQFVYDTLTNHANDTQADLRQSLDRLGVDYTPYYLVNALEVRGGLLHRLWLANNPAVDRIIPSPVLRPVQGDLSVPSAPASAPGEPQWNLSNIGADRVWREFGVRGQGIIIGQSDSGVQWDHPELLDGYLGSDNNHDGYWLDPWRGTAVPNDVGGHGTHTLGSIVGNTVGVAPDASWYACANLVRNLGNPALYLDCMQFMLAPFPQDGDPFVDGRPTQSAHVLNNSWGCPQDYEGCDANSLVTAVRALRAAGIFVVASAGNDGPDCSTVADPIALYDEVFSVGAIDSQNNIASFSSTGPVLADGSGRIKPDIAAPGVDVLSSMPGNGYAVNSGTSMAGPHVAGVVALLWSANPALIGDIERTEEILRTTATRYEVMSSAIDPTDDSCLAQTDTAVVPNNIAGYGVVNAFDAVKLALDN